MGASDRPGEELDPSQPAEFRRALGTFASGVVVVAAKGLAGDPVGMTCQSFASLSLDPPLVMFCPSGTSTTFPRIQRAGELCISILATDQHHLSGQFARSGTDKWRGVGWTPGRNGAPRINEAVLWCEGTIEAQYPGGDHHIVVVRATTLELSRSGRAPLIFHDGRYAAAEYLADAT